MNDTFGFVRVAAAVPAVKVADTAGNAAHIVSMAREADAAGAQILVFPECSITGYTVNDLFHQEALQQGAIAALNYICDETSDCETVIVAGLPIAADNQLFNCAVFIKSGHCLGLVPKTFIPGYKEYYEQRWFAPGTHMFSTSLVINDEEVPCGTNLLFQAEDIPGLIIGIEICEDLWVPSPPSSQLAVAGATLLLNLSASNELIAKSEYRRNLVCHQSGSCVAAYVMSSAGVHESTTDMVFSGHALIAENGILLTQSRRFHRDNKLISADVDIGRLIRDRQLNTSFSESIGMAELDYRVVPFVAGSSRWAPPLRRDIPRQPFVPQNEVERDRRCEEIFAIQTTGLAKRIEHCDTRHIVIGVSGGLDSTLALLVCVKAFDVMERDRAHIHAVTMPGFGTSDRTYQNVKALAEALQIELREIDITSACLKHFDDIGHDPEVHDIVYENVQARERTQVLMNRANQLEGLLVGTGDLSELALGWCTYNGDHMSMYNVNCGVPKTLVRYLIQWVAETQVREDTAAVLHDILDTPISPELLPTGEKGEIAQKTEDTVGPYELHDFFLYYMVRFGERPRKIRFLAEQAFQGTYSSEEITHWLRYFYRRFFSQQFKRSCIPDGPKVGTVSLSPRGDWRMPSDAEAATWLAELD
jgi:NAD+ synthase (glutamine-hydrolysing)